MEKNRYYPLAAVLLAVILWGLSFLSIKVTLIVLPPMTQAFIRFSIASLVLYVLLKYNEPGVKLDKKDLPMTLLAGVLGITLYFYFENNGVKLISASSASMIVATVPILTLIGDFIVFKSPLTKKKIISVILSVIGVYFIVGAGSNGQQSESTWFGYLMMFGATIAWVVYTIMTKSLFNKYSELVIVYYQTIFGTVALLPFAIFEKTNWSAVTDSIVLNLVFLGVFCSALANYFYVYAMEKIGVSICSLLMNFVPVVTVIASYFILKESIALSQLLGGLLVITAVYICNLEKEEPPADIPISIPMEVVYPGEKEI
ncbi:MAG: DMT family transporter [Bacillota bacterium]